MLVAHKIDEILDVADRVTVLRGGRTVMTDVRSRVEAEELIRVMVGADVAATLGGRTAAGEGEC